MPKLWLIEDDSPNAFATGRNPEHASVAFTAGILKLMNDELISALEKLETWSQRIPMANVNPATAHLFIVKPFSGAGFVR